ncbi:hypothetical protein [Subtercola boreus]|uniref:Uncharacterized protein n=1 Tax=Subtercola boreus TaxID=120213 RepID=A0A3E0W8P6_9MICO|nr:hypothetical protein [Subtercola boreus]RFA19859.1 hypothetical protein B7R24_11105 [Subtercola boreus]RFA19926.1 hypothetical protein B7R23_11085 [Subtercola boreus]RFA26319.1 hypothetical protein B7R25_11205 [Subtercola boreus]
MNEYDDEPELAGYEPLSGRPLRSARKVRMMRAVVILGIVALVLPGILTTYSLAKSTAGAACAANVAYRVPSAKSSSARFELFGPSGVGWVCYSVGAYGGDRRPVAPLGLIPTYPTPAELQQLTPGDPLNP